MPEQRALKDIYELLFGGRQCGFINFGQGRDGFDFLAALRGQTTATMQGLDLDVQVRASRGLFPLLVMVWKVEVPRDMSAREAERHFSGDGSNENKAEYTYQVIFCSRAECKRIHRELCDQLVSRTRGHFPPQMQDVITRPDLIVAEQWWPMRQGDQLVQLYVANAPIPGHNPQG